MYNIFLISDLNHSPGLFALINSIYLNTNNHRKIKLNILVYENKKFFIDKIDQILNNKIIYEIKEFIKYTKYINILKNNINVIDNTKNKKFKYIDNLLNFSRFFLPNIFDNVDIGIYLDVDMIVLTDITKICQFINEENNKFIKFNSTKININDFNCASCLNRSLSLMNYNKKFNINNELYGFNAGIYIFNFKKWMNENLTDKCFSIMKEHKEKNLFKGGTQPIINLIYYNKCINIDSKWNKTGLGSNEYSIQKLKNYFILHWTGRKKPWLENGLNKEIWNNYIL